MRGFELPSHSGLTHVLDKGLGPRGWEDVLEVAGEHAYVDGLNHILTEFAQVLVLHGFQFQ